MVLLHESSRDWLLVAVVALLAVGANLPGDWFDVIPFDQRYFLFGLIGVVAVALVRYLKFALLLIVVFLAIGANLPEAMARDLGIDSQILLVGLAAMVIVSLSNRLWKLPSGVERPNRPPSVHGAAALFNAILKGRIAVVQILLKQGANVNTCTVSGKTPLMAAAHKGYGDLVQMLIEHGADAKARDRQGSSALTFALRGGYTRAAELLRAAGVEE